MGLPIRSTSRTQLDAKDPCYLATFFVPIVSFLGFSPRICTATVDEMPPCSPHRATERGHVVRNGKRSERPAGEVLRHAEPGNIGGSSANHPDCALCQKTSCGRRSRRVCLQQFTSSLPRRKGEWNPRKLADDALLPTIIGDDCAAISFGVSPPARVRMPS
jgi:hypothetical protein